VSLPIRLRYAARAECDASADWYEGNNQVWALVSSRLWKRPGLTSVIILITGLKYCHFSLNATKPKEE